MLITTVFLPGVRIGKRGGKKRRHDSGPLRAFSVNRPMVQGGLLKATAPECEEIVKIEQYFEQLES